ncbi:MAG: hypothetical protein QXD48_01085 [Candidatus Aenigmatarchaeota archaeon]
MVWDDNEDRVEELENLKKIKETKNRLKEPPTIKLALGALILAISIYGGIHSYSKGVTKALRDVAIGPIENVNYTEAQNPYLWEFLGSGIGTYAGLRFISSAIKERRKNRNYLQYLIRIYENDALDWGYYRSTIQKFLEEIKKI